MAAEVNFSQTRDRFGPRMAELARKLTGSPSQRDIDLVRGELERLARG